MNTINFKQARFSDNYKYIIDSEGNRINYNDPRVVHIWSMDTNEYTSKMIKSIFEKRGWNCRLLDCKTSYKILQHAKKLCSGKECLPCNAIAGFTYKDIIEKRGENEISIYYNLDQEGPCQNGAWPEVWNSFSRRLMLKNIVFLAYPCIDNNYLGQGEIFAAEFIHAFLLGDIFAEAKNSLKCIAVNKDEALKIFEAESEKVVESAKKGLLSIYSAFKKWAVNMNRIPYKTKIHNIPKVLLFGGVNVLYAHQPITDYFCEQGIIPKVVDTAEFVLGFESESMMRYAFKTGRVLPKQQYKILPLLLSFFNPKNTIKEIIKTLRSRMHIHFIDMISKNYRKIALRSGLVYDDHIPFYKIQNASHEYVTSIAFTETGTTVGRYLCTLKSDIFDALINVSAFNCQPALNSQAIIRPLASISTIPYAAIDLEGPWLSDNQRRLLDAIVVQARRNREKN